MLLQDRESLLSWYRREARDLPWRRTRDPYAILVSEIMLQQTTVAAVVPLYGRWMDRFPTVESLAQADLQEVMHYWSGLGYYQRARRLHAAARVVAASGEFPDSQEALLALPGIGDYTASAVASIAFDLPHLALDTNAIRVLYRYYGLAELPSHRPSLSLLKERLSGALRACEPGTLNQALIELGAKVCSVRNPACEGCCWRENCQAHAQQKETLIPLKPVKKSPKITVGVATMVSHQRRLLLAPGTTLGVLGDLYQPPMDFPGHNSERSPLTPILSRIRELAQPHDDRIVTYGISGRKLRLSLQRLDRKLLESTLEIPRSWRWVNPQRPDVPVSSLTRKLLKAFRESP